MLDVLIVWIVYQLFVNHVASTAVDDVKGERYGRGAMFGHGVLIEEFAKFSEHINGVLSIVD